MNETATKWPVEQKRQDLKSQAGPILPKIAVTIAVFRFITIAVAKSEENLQHNFRISTIKYLAF